MYEATVGGDTRREPLSCWLFGNERLTFHQLWSSIVSFTVDSHSLDKIEMKGSSSHQVADEMFPDGPYGMHMNMETDDGAGGGSNMMDLTANEKFVHADFYNDFDDLCDDDDLE